MKICQILGGNEAGGLEKHFAELCNTLSTRHDVTAIAHPIYRNWLVDAVDFKPVDLSRSRRNPSVLWQTLKAIKSCRPDIVHAHANKAASILASLRSMLNIRSVATVHSLKKNVNMYDYFDQVIAVSKNAADQLTNPDYEIIYNGIVPPVLPETTGKSSLCRDFFLSGQRPVLIAVGRLVPVKGFDLLLRAMQGIDADLLIVGDGPVKSSLETLAAQLGLTDRVQFTGHRDDVPRLLASADLAIISSHKEGFPYVLVEALHVRQAVLSTEVPGSTDLLPEQMLVPCDNISALHKGISAYLESSEQLRPLFEPLWLFAARELTLDGMVEKIEKLYRQVLSRG